MARTFYINRNHQNRGPYEIDQLRTMILDGILRATDLVRPEGYNNWRQAGTVAELTPIFAMEKEGVADPGTRQAVYDAHRNPGPVPAKLGGGISIANAAIDQERILRFRKDILIVGVIWIIFGVAFLVIAFKGLVSEGEKQDPELPPRPLEVRLFTVLVLATIGVAWMVVGIVTLTRTIGGVYAGLTLSYLFLAMSALSCNACGVVLVFYSIFAAHRILDFAKIMMEAEVPLDVEP